MADNATTLRGISELRGFLRTNQTPVYFISPIAFHLLGIDRWVRQFYYVNYFDFACQGYTLDHDSPLIPVAPVAFGGCRVRTNTSCRCSLPTFRSRPSGRSTSRSRARGGVRCSPRCGRPTEPPG